MVFYILRDHLRQADQLITSHPRQSSQPRHPSKIPKFRYVQPINNNPHHTNKKQITTPNYYHLIYEINLSQNQTCSSICFRGCKMVKKISKMVFLFIILESIKSRTLIQEEAIITTHINRDKDRSIVSGIK